MVPGIGRRNVVFVVGASSGFGKLLVRQLSSHGHWPVAGMREVSGRNESVARSFHDLGVPVVEIDINSDKSVRRAFSRVAGIVPELDVVVNCAGFGLMGRVELATSADLYRQFNTNVFGAHRVATTAVPLMRRRGHGLIVQLSSGAGRVAFPGAGVYCASKWALEALTETLHRELQGSGVGCLILQLGPYATDFSTRSLQFVSGYQATEAKTASTPLVGGLSSGIQGDPEEVVSELIRIIDSPRPSADLRVILHPLRDQLRELNEDAERMASSVISHFGPQRT